MNQLKWLMAFALLISSTEVMSCDMHGKTGIVEENDMYIPVGAKTKGGITQTQFNEIIDQANELFYDVIADKGATLKIVKHWNDGTVNAYARQLEEAGKAVWEVHMFGGLARHQTVTPDGFALVVCHELGHHLGGAPKKLGNYGKARWASNEGQADYWGVMKCLRKMFKNDKRKSFKGNAFVARKCAKQFSNSSDRNLCERTAMSGHSLASLFKELRKLPTPVQFNKPDRSVVSTTFHSHPQPQCRLDTYFAGSLCTEPSYTEVSDTDATVGVCNRITGQTLGVRPLCWYKPN